jgi:outer membrane protein assembly factor BamE (lipoprotein component of BamABCDE complex)
MKRHIFIMIMLALINWGCASSTVSYQPAKTEFGKPIDIVKYDQIVEGKTTESQIIALLGDPSRIMDRPDGKIYQYIHFQTQHSGSFASPSGTKGLSSHTMLMFKIKNGVVVKKARMVGSQPIEIKPETVVITPGKDKP